MSFAEGNSREEGLTAKPAGQPGSANDATRQARDARHDIQVEGKLNILQIASKVPYPVWDGGRGGIYHITRQFLRLGANVHFAAPGVNANDADGFRKIVTLHLLDVDPTTRAVSAIRNVAGLRPYNIAKYYSDAALRQLEEIIRQNRFDLIHVDGLHMAAYGLKLKSASRIPVMLREHNVESEIMRYFMKATENPVLRFYADMQYRKLLRYEADAVSRFDMVIPISGVDDAKLKQIAPLMKSTVIPAGVDTEALRFGRSSATESVLVFVNYDWLPNRDSVQFYIEEILPHLRRIKPGIRTVLVGRDTRKLRGQTGTGSIEVMGFVDDLNDLPGIAAVAVVPLRIGSGMRIKILELMALGIPIVSTALGAEGIDVIDGEHIILADEPETFARRVSNLLDSQGERMRIAANARALVERSYSWNSVGDRFRQCYLSLIDRP